MKRISIALASLAVLAAPPASAMPQRGAFHAPMHGPAFGGHVGIGPHAPVYWRGGHWYNGFHGGSLAWWWIVGDDWYLYPQPIYPYPAYAPLAAPPPGPATGVSPVQSWYYCDNPAGYYPYVPTCSVPWRETPAMPPGPIANTPPQ